MRTEVSVSTCNGLFWITNIYPRSIIGDELQKFTWMRKGDFMSVTETEPRLVPDYTPPLDSPDHPAWLGDAVLDWGERRAVIAGSSVEDRLRLSDFLTACKPKGLAKLVTVYRLYTLVIQPVA